MEQPGEGVKAGKQRAHVDNGEWFSLSGNDEGQMAEVFDYRAD